MAMPRIVLYSLAVLALATLAACTERTAGPESAAAPAADRDRSAAPPGRAITPAPDVWHDSAAVVWALNVGGAAHVGLGGVEYEADRGRYGGRAGRIEGEILGSQDDTVYRTFRTGALAIRRPLANGYYDIGFQFAEPEDIAAGERVFDVLVQGRTAIDDLDIRLARDGNRRAALDRTVMGVHVGNGRLEIDFAAAAAEPVLSALVVRERVPDERPWELVWADEFDYRGPPDPANWNIEVWPRGKVNDEDQAYTDRERNVRVAGGSLILEAHRESYRDAQYTSGRIHSRGKRDFLYGRVDIRARLPAGRGTWPALWMLPSDAFRYATACGPGEDWQGNAECDAWPNSGEIDIMEHVGYDMNLIHGTVHNRAYYWANGEQRKASVRLDRVDEDFHLYSIEWTPEAIRVFCDGSPYFFYFRQAADWKAWPYDHPYHLVFNLAVGGSWGGAGGPIDDTVFPVSLEVDYVRLFRPATRSAGERDSG